MHKEGHDIHNAVSGVGHSLDDAGLAESELCLSFLQPSLIECGIVTIGIRVADVKCLPRTRINNHEICDCRNLRSY